LLGRKDGTRSIVNNFGTAELQLPITFWFSISGSEGKKKYRKDKPWDHEGIDHWKPVLLSIASARCSSALLYNTVAKIHVFPNA